MRSSRTAIVVGLIAVITAALVYSIPRPGDASLEDTGSVEALHTSPGSAAMRVSIDPETGELVHGQVPAGKPEDAQLQEALSRSDEGLVEVHHADGSVSIDLQGRFQNASIARIDSTGKLHTTCVDSPEAVHAFCNGQHAPKPSLEVR